MSKSLKNNYWVLMVGCFSLLMNCSTREKDDYEILNLVMNYRIRPNDFIVFKYIDKEDAAVTKKHGNSSRMNLDSLALYNVFSNYKYSFTLKDSLFVVTGDVNDLPNKKWWMYNVSIEKYNDREKIQLEKLHFKKNYVLLKSEKDTIDYRDRDYIGDFSFSRVLYDNSGGRAFVKIINKLNNKIADIGFVELEKRDGKWIIIK